MFIALINEQVSVLTLMSQFKKPTSILVFLSALSTATFQQIDEVKRKDFKAPPNHLQTLIDGIPLMSWYNYEAGDVVRDAMKEFYDAVFFYGNKVLKLDKPLDTAWFEAYKNLFSAHYNFVVSRNDSITKWTGTGDAAGAEKAFKSGVVATFASATVTFTPTTAPEEAKKAPVTVKKAPVQKAAVKENKNNRWNVENYSGGAQATFSGDEVNKDTTFSLFGNKDSSFTIDGKCKSILLEGCKKVKIYVDSVVSEVSIMNCSAIELRGKTQMKTVTVENSSEVKIHLTNATRDCTVTTICCRSVFVNAPKVGTDGTSAEEADWVKVGVPEIYLSNIKGDEMVTKAAEIID